ncbi:MAG: C_GCAxxG_C_C family protein [Candidatus Latescibacteria bacterium]|nr:C_GCAxxG_C_C family protein [Candidatus Latescibacterota bacterium]
MNKVDCAVSCFEEGFSCSQAVFSTYGPQLGLDRERALKIAGTFGGGMGRMGETCGAVTGAFVVIGLKYGNSKAEDNPSKEKAYSLVREFADRFQSRNGTIGCRELLGCELSTPEGRALAREKNLFATICPKLVQDAAKIIEQILE